MYLNLADNDHDIWSNQIFIYLFCDYILFSIKLTRWISFVGFFFYGEINILNFFRMIINHPNDNLSFKMKQALKLYKENIKYIENTFYFNINNGIIEGTNNFIKTIKRIAFGYRKFDHFISRIFLIKGIIKE